MSKDKSANNGHIGLGSLTFLLFLALKLTGHITWSWWWVTAPLWGGLCIILLASVIAGVLAGLAHKAKS